MSVQTTLLCLSGQLSPNRKEGKSIILAHQLGCKNNCYSPQFKETHICHFIYNEQKVERRMPSFPKIHSRMWSGKVLFCYIHLNLETLLEKSRLLE